jgi:hypothetical protein
MLGREAIGAARCGTSQSFRDDLRPKLEEVLVYNKQAPPKAPVSAAAERMRRHRQRKREGLRSLTIEVREAEIDALMRSGFLEKSSRDDANAVTQALYRVFDRVFRVTRNVSTPW